MSKIVSAYCLMLVLMATSGVRAAEGVTAGAGSAYAVSDQLTSWVAGYCKGRTDRYGDDFASCFRVGTDMAIKLLEERAELARQGSAQERK